MFKEKRPINIYKSAAEAMGSVLLTIINKKVH